MRHNKSKETNSNTCYERSGTTSVAAACKLWQTEKVMLEEFSDPDRFLSFVHHFQAFHILSELR